MTEEEKRTNALLSESNDKNKIDESNKISEQSNTLGYVKTTEQKDVEEQAILRKEGEQIGFRDVKIDILPTRGITLPTNAKISARALTLEQIKHYSSMDEEEIMDVEEKIGDIFDKCIRLYFGDELKSWRDLPETDRIFCMFFLRDLTMQAHARDIKLYHTAQAPDGTTKRIEITNDIFAYNKIPDNIIQFYNADERCFIIRDNNMEIIRFSIPTMGVVFNIKKYIKDKLTKQQRGEPGNYNKILIDRYAEWLITDWRKMSEQDMAMLHQKFSQASPELLDVLDYLHKEFKYHVKPTIEIPYGNDGKSFESVIIFPRGISNIFNLSDFVDRLFKNRG